MKPSKLQNKVRTLIDKRLRTLLKCKGRLKYDTETQTLIHCEITKALEIAERFGYLKENK